MYLFLLHVLCTLPGHCSLRQAYISTRIQLFTKFVDEVSSSEPGFMALQITLHLSTNKLDELYIGVHNLRQNADRFKEKEPSGLCMYRKICMYIYKRYPQYIYIYEYLSFRKSSLSSSLICIIDEEGVISQELNLLKGAMRCNDALRALGHFSSCWQVTVILTLKSWPCTNLGSKWLQDLWRRMETIQNLNTLTNVWYPNVMFFLFLWWKRLNLQLSNSFFLRACACGPSTL